MIICGERPLRGKARRANGLAFAGAWARSISRFCLCLAFLSGFPGFFCPAFSQGQSSPPDFHCLHVPKDQWHACIGGDLAGWYMYQSDLEQYRDQKAGGRPAAPPVVRNPVATGQPPVSEVSSLRSRKEQLVDLKRHQAEEMRQLFNSLQREQAQKVRRPGYNQADFQAWRRYYDESMEALRARHNRELAVATRLADEEKVEERRRADRERAERQAVLERQQALERERQERIRQEEIAQRQEAARVLAVQRQEEQARQAEQYRRLQAEAVEREAQQEAAAFRDATVFLENVSGGMAVMVAVLAFTPAYRLYATRRLMTLSQWEYQGHLIISAIAFGIFFWLVAIHPAESAGAAYLAAMSGVVGLLAAFFLPGALLLLAQYVHYLFVPHPSEAYIDQARRSDGVDLDAATRAGEFMYDPGQGDSFTEWRLENRARRAGAKAEMLRKETEVMEELIRNQKAKARQPLE